MAIIVRLDDKLYERRMTLTDRAALEAIARCDR